MRSEIFRVLVLCFILLAGSYVASAQYFSVGNDPSLTRWRVMDHAGVRLIYPDYYESAARELLISSISILPAVSSSMKITPDKFRAVIHPETNFSNGWTMWVPRKVELAPMPSLYPMAERYSDHLLIHEFRHIAQVDKMEQGVTKVLGWFLGDQASASVQAIQIPDWVSEGDAVLAETLLSHSGRGRSPLFSQGMRALLLDSCSYNFEQARFGSYKDFYPNHYVFGYHLVSMARTIDKEDFWPEVWDNIARRPWRLASFNRYLHKRTGLWQGALFRQTTDYLSEYWKENSVDIGNAQLRLISESSHDYFNYLKPYSETDSSWICLKTSYDDIPSIVRIIKGKADEKIIYTGSINGDSFSYTDGLLAWAQQISDPRWEMRSFSDIFTYDIKTGSRERISRNQRYLYPVLNAEGTSIACIEEAYDGQCRLLILDINGTVVLKSEATAGITLRQPVWSAEGQQVYALASGREGKKLVIWDLRENDFRLLKDFGYKEINDLQLYKDQIIFTAPLGTVQGLYAFSLTDNKIHQIISSNHGLAHPAVSRGELGVSLYTPRGYRPSVVVPDEAGWVEVVEVDDLKEPMLGGIEKDSLEKPVEYKDIDTLSINSREYKKLSNLFNFHSWAPVFLDPDNYMIRPGAMIMSQNDLNTLITSFGIQHNKQSKSIDYFANISFTGLYPDISLNVLGGKRLADSLILDRDTLRNVSFSDVSTSGRIMLPLFFSKGAYYQRIQPYFSISHHRIFNGISLDNPEGGSNNFDFSYASATLGIAGQVLRRMSYRELFPRWGFTAGLQADAGISNPEVQAFKRYSGYIRFYTPGILKNHSIRSYLGYTDQDRLGIPQLPFVSLPRGHYEASNYDYASYKFDYSFPVAYPDWSVPALVYITRVKANIFTDGRYSQAHDNPWSFTTGIDLLSNFYVLRIKAEIEAGARIIFDPLKREWNYEFLYSFDID